MLSEPMVPPPRLFFRTLLTGKSAGRRHGFAVRPRRYTVTKAPSGSSTSLETIAGLFHPPEQIKAIDQLGAGNVNDTFLVTLEPTAPRQAFVMQRLNTDVFESPELVMRNLLRLGDHVERRLAEEPPELSGRRWEIPRVLPTLDADGHWVEHEGEFWRSISYIGAATTTDVIKDEAHAWELGYGLGMFHHLISDLPTEELADTLENFHIAPAYLAELDAVIGRTAPITDARVKEALAFVDARREGLDVLEQACARGELKRRPIHGDPKINNVMIDDRTGHAVGLIDLDTVKPGLLHYDIGDCLRSCCNRLGEETATPEHVVFDLGLCRSILEGYLKVGRSFLSDDDVRHLPACIRLIPLELGLRFLSDHLSGDCYFKTERAGHNLDRAMVQFALTHSIELQWDELVSLIESLRGVS